MVEAIATLLNTLIQRVLFSHMTIFLTLLFVSFVFTPPEWEVFLLSKQTENVPDWLSLLTFGRIIFTCLATMLWILSQRFLVWLWRKIADYVYPRFRRHKSYKAWETVYQSLSKDELDKIMLLISAGGAPLEIRNNAIRTSLLSKKVILLKQFGPLFQSYVLTPSFYHFMLDKIQQENQKS